MSIITALLILLQSIAIILLIVWWLLWTPHGWEWVALLLFAAAGIAHLSSRIFQVPPYQVGCQGLCPGWMGYPHPSYHIEAGGVIRFDSISFVRNTFFYYAILLGLGALLVWLARQLRITSRPWPQRIIFILVIILFLATLPMWVPPPQPLISGPEKRIVINAARDWSWQLHMRGFMERRLAVEDVRFLPADGHYRVCFRTYTWFYIPYNHVYLDMEPEGVRALSGTKIPLSESCWKQP